MSSLGTAATGYRAQHRQQRDKRRQDRVKANHVPLGGLFAGPMSIESGLLVAAVVALAIYLLAALIFPERFQ